MSATNAFDLTGLWADHRALDIIARMLADGDERYRRALIELRQERGVTQAELAEALGVSQPTVAAFERVDADPKMSTLRRYALAVGAVTEHRVVPFEKWQPMMSRGAMPVTVVPSVAAVDTKRTDFSLAA